MRGAKARKPFFLLIYLLIGMTFGWWRQSLVIAACVNPSSSLSSNAAAAWKWNRVCRYDLLPPNEREKSLSLFGISRDDDLLMGRAVILLIVKVVRNAVCSRIDMIIKSQSTGFPSNDMGSPAFWYIPSAIYATIPVQRTRQRLTVPVDPFHLRSLWKNSARIDVIIVRDEVATMLRSSPSLYTVSEPRLEKRNGLKSTLNGVGSRRRSSRSWAEPDAAAASLAELPAYHSCFFFNIMDVKVGITCQESQQAESLMRTRESSFSCVQHRETYPTSFSFLPVWLRAEWATCRWTSAQIINISSAVNSFKKSDFTFVWNRERETCCYPFIFLVNVLGKLPLMSRESPLALKSEREREKLDDDVV